MHRYLSSFIISSLFYITLFASVFYAFNTESFSDEDVVAENTNKVSFTIITPENKPKEKRTEPKPKPKPLEKKPAALSEPIIKKPIPKEVKEEPKLEKKKIINTNSDNINSDENIKAKKQLFIANLMKRINSNKSYPHTARRRCIQGVVEMKFTILANGNVKDIHVISGENVFKKSATQAIKRSFPVEIDTKLFDFPKEFKIKIAYVLK